MVLHSARSGGRLPGDRCRHDLPAAQCGMCQRPRVPAQPGAHLDATAILRCRECRSDLLKEDANRTSLVALLMRGRRAHSDTAHAGSLDTLSSADVVLKCNVCGEEFDVLDVNTTS